MKKIGMLLSGAVLAMTMLAGCTTQETKNTKETEKKNHVYKEGEVAGINGLEITFDKVQMLKSEDKKEDVLHLQFKIENKSVVKKGFSAIELEVKNSDNKNLEVYPGENFGKEIAGGGSDTGSGYFTAKGSGPYTVTYTDAITNKTINWKLNLDK